MESDLSTSSLSSSSPSMNTSTKDENSAALNDVVAVSNGADTRTHFLKQTELIMNFGYAAARTVFDMSTDEQKTLLDRINDPGQLAVTTDGHDLLSNALERNILEYGELVEMVCSLAIREDNDVTVNRLADLLAEVALEKKNLAFIEKKLRMKNDLVTTRFLKKCLWKIGILIGKLNVDHFDNSLALFNQHCWQLITTYCEP
ncbi:unnamed protein product [Rotaria socialis]|uniref:Uncharacterized protein n=1 Tax=Rotaria socialis TaxID=392032 RepID=A0A818SKT9_9BILA|nr:unnamed protein product [Rotaria socialis]CAF3668984.1 unnamed protein product [Rotaria socialis]CAF4451315.1 unnamed protein product [Rotaria socialis]